MSNFESLSSPQIHYPFIRRRDATVHSFMLDQPLIQGLISSSEIETMKTECPNILRLIEGAASEVVLCSDDESSRTRVTDGAAIGRMIFRTGMLKRHGTVIDVPLQHVESLETLELGCLKVWLDQLVLTHEAQLIPVREFIDQLEPFNDAKELNDHMIGAALCYDLVCSAVHHVALQELHFIDQYKKERIISAEDELAIFSLKQFRFYRQQKLD